MASKQVGPSLAPDQWEGLWAPEVAASHTVWPLQVAAYLAQRHKRKVVDLAALSLVPLLLQLASAVAQPVYLISAGLLSSAA